jgi:hypothetical protein
MTLSGSLRGLERLAREGTSTVAWPARIVLGGLCEGWMTPLVEAVERIGHGAGLHEDCEPCNLLVGMEEDLVRLCTEDPMQHSLLAAIRGES